MKICLVTPSGNGLLGAWSKAHPPLGILYIAAVLEREGHAVTVIDGAADSLTNNEIARRVAAAAPDFVGLSILTILRFSAVDLSRRIREQLPRVCLVWGGEHVSFLAAAMAARYPEVDYFVAGEGETGFLAALDRPAGRVIQAEPVTDLDALPFPARHLVDLEAYHRRARRQELYRSFPIATVMTARGCVARCAYCSSCNLFKQYRRRSAQSVAEEIEELYRRHGIREIRFFDDTFNTSVEWLAAFNEALAARHLSIHYHCHIRAHPDPDLYRLLRTGGCYYASLGIESGSPAVLKAMGKNVTREDIEQTVHAMREEGIFRKGFFMIGFPGETPEDIQATRDFLRQLPLNDFALSICMLFPGSRYADAVGEDSWFADAERTDDGHGFLKATVPLVCPEAREELGRLARAIVREGELHYVLRRWRGSLHCGLRGGWPRRLYWLQRAAAALLHPVWYTASPLNR